MKRHWLIPLVLVFASLNPSHAEPAAETPIRVLIIDGLSNHDWQRTTELIKGVLAPTKLFDVSVSSAPATLDAPDYATWCPDFSKCDVVLVNYNNLGQKVTWNNRARTAFEQFVKDGGGAFIFHSANNAFADWPAYNEMIGLGWRNKDFGDAIQIGPDEKPVRIPAGQGGGTSHQARTDRLIHLIGDDPIHAGMPRKFMTPLIEVYNYTRGPARNLTVESWAEDPKTGVRWPIEWVVTYGKGRIYASSFGHVWRDEADPVDLRDAAFQTIMVRALQWLAQRPVSFPVPADFPGPNSTSLRPLPLAP
jgi:hypothetical protein